MIAQIFNATAELVIPLGNQLMMQKEKLKHNH